MDTGEDYLERITILEVLDHIIDKGVVISGNLVISVAGVDLIYAGLQLVLASVDALVQKDPGGNYSGLSLLPHRTGGV